MLIDYISDIHEDVHCKEDLTKESFIKHFSKLFPAKTGEILLIAGDLSHVINRIYTFLRLTKEIYGYERIFYVLGNHELYLFKQWERDSYKYSSLNKIIDIKKKLKPLEKFGIYLLDGNIVEYKEKRFGGLCMWYDGSFLKKKYEDITDEEIVLFQKETIPDWKYIYGIGNFQSHYIKEFKKLLIIYKNCDIILTHINPISEEFAFSEEYKDSDTNGFFAFDGEDIVKETPAIVWLYGHTHIPKEFEVHNTKLICNPVGYPAEYRKDRKIKQIKI